MYFFLTIKDLLRIALYNTLSKRPPPRAAKIKPVLFIKLGKEKRQPFNRRPKFFVCKKDTVGNGFLFIANSNRVVLILQVIAYPTFYHVIISISHKRMFTIG